MFSGTEETPGDVFEDNGKRYKTYRGMGSIAAMEAGSKDRYFQGKSMKLKNGTRRYRSPRRLQGALADVLAKMMTAIREEMAKMDESSVADLSKMVV
ncbi:IMP dehydrogenase [Leuconostoc citreum]